VLDELVVVAQSVVVEHLVVVHHDGVVQPATQRQAVGAHHLDVPGEAEGARARDVPGIGALAEVEFDALWPVESTAGW
jgi:hypothetical protein